MREYFICTIPFFTHLGLKYRSAEKNRYREKLREAGFENDQYRFPTEAQALLMKQDIFNATGLEMTVTKATDF